MDTSDKKERKKEIETKGSLKLTITTLTLFESLTLTVRLPLFFNEYRKADHLYITLIVILTHKKSKFKDSESDRIWIGQ